MPAKREKIKFQCDYCGADCEQHKAQYDRNKRHFCNNKCYSLFVVEKMPQEERNLFKIIHNGSKRHHIDLGKRYGLLTIVGEAPDYVYSNGKKERRIIVKCDCGTIKPMLYKNRNLVLSCGCNRRNDIKILIERAQQMSKTPEIKKAEILAEIKKLELELWSGGLPEKTFYNKIETLTSLTDTFLK